MAFLIIVIADQSKLSFLGLAIFVALILIAGVLEFAFSWYSVDNSDAFYLSDSLYEKI